MLYRTDDGHQVGEVFDIDRNRREPVEADLLSSWPDAVGMPVGSGDVGRGAKGKEYFSCIFFRKDYNKHIFRLF